MAEEVGIVMTLYDRVSPTLKSITGNSKAFDKSLDELEASLKAYDKAQGELVDRAADLKKALAETDVKVKNAQKSYRKLKDEASKGALDEAIDEQARLRRELNDTEVAIKENSAAYKDLYKSARDAANSISKAENRAGGSGGMGMLSALGKAGLLNMAGDSVSALSQMVIGSVFGGSSGTLISGVLGGAAQGAAMGSLLGLPGMATGAIIGGGLGLITGGTQVFQEKDAAFKDYVQESVQGHLEGMAQGISSGSATAAQRELDSIAFNRLLGEGVGDTFLTELRTMAAETPMEYADLTSMSRALATGFKDAPDRILELMKAIGDAGSAVGVTASDMTAMAQAMSRMQSSGKSTLEYLNIFQDRGVDVIGMLSEAMGKTQGEIYDMISKGSISGTQAVDIIQQGLGQYAGAMDEMSRTFSGLESTLNDARTEMDNAYGKGYNAERNIGMQAEIDYLNGENSAALRETNEALGAWRASLENTKEQYRREAELAVTAGTEAASLTEDAQKRLSELREQYLLADGDAVEQGRIIAEAQILAQGEYMASDGAQQLVEYEKSLATAVREDAASNDAYWDAGYRKGQEYNKGILAARSSFQMPTGPGLDENGLLENWTDDGGNVHTSGGGDGWYDDGGNFHPYAFGIWRVPYDNFPALLHQGERVLTAREAGETDRNRTPIQITITGNQFGAGVTAEEIAQRLADALEIKLAAGRVRT